jgi:acyl-CoA carboxylase epsilon subunit
VSAEGAPPILRVLHGDPSAEDLAALVAVLAAASGVPVDAGQPSGERSQWAAPARLLRQPVAPTGWWASGLPS